MFVHTLSSLTNFAPTSSRDPSARPKSCQPAKLLFPPFYEFDSFFAHEQILPLKPIFTDKDILDLFWFGRPIWSTITNETALISIATSKLLCNEAFSYTNDVQHFAILSCRLGEYVSLTSEVSVELVRSYVAVCSKISEKRDVLQVSYWTEPVLFEAALQLWSLYFDGMIQTWGMFLSKGYVDAGIRGEVLGKIILLLAFDSCIQNSKNINKRYYTPILLTNFLQNLGANLAKHPLPKNIDDRNAYVLITH